MEPLRGKFYTQIKENVVSVADQEVKVKNLFGAVPRYKIPVIEYTKASQRQIHEVFKLYNKQGMHLNAEEIRNAIYHDIELTRAILASAGDTSRQIHIIDVAPSLEPVPGIEELGQTLIEYGFGGTRYRRTKVLGWVLATLLNDTGDKDMLSTARHIDLLLARIQETENHPLREQSALTDLFTLVAQAVDLHAAHDELWSDRFKDGGKGAKWQELQLVGSLVGMILAVSSAPTEIDARIAKASSDIHAASSTEEWERPEKTQTRTQWDYIARIVLHITELLGVDPREASDGIRKRFGSSGIDSLLASIIPESST